MSSNSIRTVVLLPVINPEQKLAIKRSLSAPVGSPLYGKFILESNVPTQTIGIGSSSSVVQLQGNQWRLMRIVRRPTNLRDDSNEIVTLSFIYLIRLPSALVLSPAINVTRSIFISLEIRAGKGILALLQKQKARVHPPISRLQRRSFRLRSSRPRLRCKECSGLARV